MYNYNDYTNANALQSTGTRTLNSRVERDWDRKSKGKLRICIQNSMSGNSHDARDGAIVLRVF